MQTVDRKWQRALELRNRWIHFKVRDVYFPDVEKVLCDLYGNNVLQGKVVDVSQGASPDERFAVVSVEGLDQQIVVPVHRILGVL
jgi:hypothetical protein